MSNGIIVPHPVGDGTDFVVSRPLNDAEAVAQRAIDGAADAAVTTLIGLLSPDKNDKVRLEAAKTLLDRAGLSARPRTATPPPPQDLASLDLDQIQALLDRAEAARAAAAKDVSAPVVERNDDQAIDPFS